MPVLKKQLGLGDIAPMRVAGNIEEKVEAILERFPGTRNCYRAVMLRYWVEYDGLADILGDDGAEAFGRWFMDAHKATSPKTIQNRAMEVQRRRADLDAEQTTREWRNRKARGGRVL